MKTKKSLSLLLVGLLLSLAIFAGCTASAEKPQDSQAVALQDGGSLVLSVNPKLELNYDDKGIVKLITAMNDDGKVILTSLKTISGQETRLAVVEIVKQIIDKGYLKADDNKRQVELELKKGSVLPNDDFMKDIVKDLQAFLKDNKMENKLVIDGDSDYGLSDDKKPNKPATKTTTPATGKVKVDLDGKSDYDDSNYDDTNYDDTNYDDSNYDDTNYDDTNYDDTNYDDTNYDDSNYDDTSYDDTNYDDSNYDDTNYDDTDYDDSDYDDSDYDD